MKDLIVVLEKYIKFGTEVLLIQKFEDGRFNVQVTPYKEVPIYYQEDHYEVS